MGTGHPLFAVSYFLICGENSREFSALSNFSTQNTFFLITAVMSAFRSSKYQCHREFLSSEIISRRWHSPNIPNSPPTQKRLDIQGPVCLLLTSNFWDHKHQAFSHSKPAGLTQLIWNRESQIHLASHFVLPSKVTTDLLLWRCLSYLSFPTALSEFTAR